MRIDYELLKKISLEDANKKKDAMNDSVVLSSFLKLLSNFIYELESLKVNEVALLTNSINHWVTNKTYSSTKQYKPGAIVELECGLNYDTELSYRHTGLILEVQNKSVLVIPSTSSKRYIDKSSEKKDGLWYYKLVGAKEGFDHECVLLLNNMKVVSKKRIISSFGNICKDEPGKQLFYAIKMDLLSHYFQKQYNDYEQKIKQLESDLKNANAEISSLKEALELSNSKNADLKKKCGQLYGKINWLDKKVNRK